jgi:5-methylcytosine-specific restriction endonuclease McrA
VVERPSVNGGACPVALAGQNQPQVGGLPAVAVDPVEPRPPGGNVSAVPAEVGRPAAARARVGMALTPCLDCGTLTRNSSRCSPCAAKRDNWRARGGIRSGWAWGELRAQVRARDCVCVRCGSTDRLEVHHRIPLARGGTNEISNLELRCRQCHAGGQGGALSTSRDSQPASIRDPGN